MPRRDPIARAAYQREYKKRYRERAGAKLAKKTERRRKPSREWVPPQYKAVVRALRGWFPLEHDYPLVGQEAILDWLVRHGFSTWRNGRWHRPRWKTVRDWHTRSGGFMFHTPARGPLFGRPVSSHYLMLAWGLAASQALGPPWTSLSVRSKRLSGSQLRRLKQRAAGEAVKEF